MLSPETRSRDFPVLDGMTYLNTAAESIPPIGVGEALQSYWQDKLRGMKGRDAHYARMEECREVAARAIHLDPSEVSFCSCSAEAYNLLATALNLQPGDEVVITDLDFPSGATPWLSYPTRPKVNLWHARDGALFPEHLIPLLNERTRLVQISLVSFYNGHRIAWAPFVQTVRKHAPQALISVDVTQALGRISFDCSDAGCIISSTHKWAFGIHGGCIVGIPQRHAARITTQAGGWFHLTNAFGADRFERAITKTGAASFSVGMPNFAAIYALNAGLRYIESVGVEKIASYADPLVETLYRGITELGLKAMAPYERTHGAGIISFQHPQSTALHAGLEQENIHVMHTSGRLRISIHGYNTAPEVEHFLKSLHQILRAL